MKVDVFVVVLNLLFPPTCVRCSALLLREDDTPLCTPCHTTHSRLPIEARRVGRVEALYPYEGPIGDAIRRLKFSGEMGVAGPLGRMLSAAPILCAAPSGAPWDLICPVPLHPTRRWTRGFDQAYLLAHWCMHHFDAAETRAPTFDGRLLARRRATVPQSELAATERLANIRGAFRVRSGRTLLGRRVLVVDDVTTTGATLHACFEALREAGASEVGGLSLTRTMIDAQALRLSA